MGKSISSCWFKPLTHLSNFITIHYFNDLVYNRDMSESYKNYRIKFHKNGAQKAFILEAKGLLNITGREFSRKLKISQRTLK
ncbi:MAG: hypothetical protein UU13_C0002G0055 [Candidatus Nomurabacteria bacterium GW2011_GWB1_40_7]|uniref:Uncharacterized protein n=1 Tax=Candidatus Nomurabacteria bacterium GW2011_GWB1_40_7 TaxID=1618744 RepID=A0A0G0VF89_9BACT|nr:MAG: hypothetical protein UU13_C0002G0055 [Candidatus Nomurabacteria bacterium GW2011_GWB1_40_7]